MAEALENSGILDLLDNLSTENVRTSRTQHQLLVRIEMPIMSDVEACMGDEHSTLSSTRPWLAATDPEHPMKVWKH